jgi:glycosyltransferase involved in cell wall biosynthesis
MRIGGSLRERLAGQYLKGSTALTFRMLKGRSGPRIFDRVAIVAALGRNNGIASGARLQWAAMRQCGIDAELVDATAALRNPRIKIPHQPASAYIFHSGGPQTACLIRSVLPHAATAYRVAYWAWELPDPPQGWKDCDRNVSEIWTPSGFSRSSLDRIVSRPVTVVPHYIPASAARRRSLHGPFTVLAMADSRSSFTRKNPAGSLSAFRMAFGTSRAARLLLKLNGTADQLRDLENSFGDLSGSNVEIMRGFLTPAELCAVYNQTDVLLSLHRAEGFGLPMLEAMARGIPVVATGWSGNLEFMSATDSCLVPYRLVPVADRSGVYDGSVWADPDIASAASALSSLSADTDRFSRLAAAAHRRVSTASPRFPFDLGGSALDLRSEAVA